MRPRSLLTKILNIRSEEHKPVLMLMVFSFFIGMSISFYFTASNAIFLKHFKPKMIPVSFIASGIIIYFAWWIFSHIDKKLSLYYQVVSKFLFVFLSVLAISIGVYAFDSSWMTFVMYTWVRVMVYITLVNFWGVAGRLFNVRQGKRIFALISIGEVLSYMIGYLSIPLMLQFLKTPDLLFLASVFLFICLLMVLVIFKTFKDQLQSGIVNTVKADKSSQSDWNYWKLLKKPYFRIISLMALLPIFGYLFVDFLFLAQTKVEFANNPQDIARFIAIFLGSLAFLEILMKLVSGRFLNKYGIRPSLLSLPIILVFSIILAAGFGALYGPIGMFFSFIALARLFERSIRGAVYEPAFQLLYQPVPTEQRLPFQNQIEGIPKAMGTVITGAVILIFSIFPSITLVSYTWIFIIVLGFWIWVAFKMYEEYRNMLKTKLSEMKIGGPNEKDPMVALIMQTFSDAKAGQFQKLSDFFDTVAHTSFKVAAKEIESVSSQEKKRKEEEDHTFQYMVDISRSDKVEERLMAVRLLGSSGRYNTYKLLINLINDEDPGIRNAAIISAGKVKRVELWPFIIENLVIPDCAHSAGVAVKIIGEPILQDLDRFFEKIGNYKPVQLNILRIYESIGGAKAIKFLRKKIYHPDNDIRFQALLSLSNLEYHASVSEIAFIKQIIEDSVETIVWILASLVDISGPRETELLRQALFMEMEEKKEHIFLLLSLLYDSKTIGHIRGHIESKDTNAKIYALEISDMIISDEIKELFFPIFEDLSIHDRLNRFSLRFPQEKLTLFERIGDIVNKDYSKINRWTKACAINILSLLPHGDSSKTRELLASNLVNPDPLLGELAAWALYKNYQDWYFDTLGRFEKNDAIRLSGIIGKIKSREKGADLFIFEKVALLKNTEFFAPVNEMDILGLIMGIHEPAETSFPVAPKDDKAQTGEMIINSMEGYTMHIPQKKLFELMTGDPVMIERYLRLFFLNNNV